MNVNDFLNYLADYDASNDLAGDLFDVMSMKGMVTDTDGLPDDVVFDVDAFDSTPA